MKKFTEGPLAQQLAVFALPIVVTSLLQVSMHLINGLWVGNLLGSIAFGAITVSTLVMMLVLAFVMGFNQATLSIFGQLHGKRAAQAEDSVPAQAATQEIHNYLSAFILTLSLVAGLISLLGFNYAGHLLTWLNTPTEIHAAAKMYLQINFCATPILVGYNFISTVLRAFGDSRTPLYFVLLSTLLLTFLAPLFIGVLQWDLAGAAIAMVTAQTSAFIYGIWHLLRKFPQQRLRLRLPQRQEMLTLGRQGLPSGLQMLVIHAGNTAILALVNSLGADAVAGFGAAQRLDSIILLPAVALGMAVTSMAAQNIGANNWERVKQITKIGLLYNTSIMLAIATGLYLGAKPLVGLFIQDAASLNFGINYLQTIAFFYVFLGLNFIFNGVVRGAGAMLQVLALNILSLWVLRVPLTYWTTSIYGETGVALGIGISFMLSAMFSYAFYRWGNWRQQQLFH